MPDNEINKIRDLLEDFQRICDENLAIYFSALQLNNEHPDIFTEDMKNMVVEYGLLRFFGQWERFIERCFIEYMLGEKSTLNYLPNRYVMPIDADHAYKIVQNVNQYPDWTDIAKITTNADNFFQDGGPFKTLHTLKTTLNEMKKVRNAIAHTSLKARHDFENLVRSKVGHSPEGITPAKFLSEHKIGRKKSDPTFYEYYITYVKNTAGVICGFSEEDNLM